MKENYKRLIEQLEKAAREGIFGEAALSSAKDYEGVPLDISRLTRFVNNLSDKLSTTKSEIDNATQNIWFLLVATYCDCKKKDRKVANAFAYSLIEDYPDMPNTALAVRWHSLALSTLTFRSKAFSGDPLLVWQLTSKLFLDYSEFMDGLLGFLLISLRCALGKTINPNILRSFYAIKANHFEELTNGEDGIFYLFHRLINPKLRNAIAHGKAWLDMEKNIVRYTDGRTECEYEIDLIKFGILATLGSHLGKAYIAALATIVIWEDGKEEQKQSLPSDFVELLSR